MAKHMLFYYEGKMKKKRDEGIEYSSKSNVYYDANGRKHKKFLFSNRVSDVQERDHEHEGHRHHHVRRWKRTLLTVVIVIAMMAIVVFASWSVMDALGKDTLYSHNDISELALADSSQQNQAAAEASAKGEKWESGWIRYNGKIYEYNSNILTFLIMGVDNYYKVKPASNGIMGGQADAQFLLVLNPDTKKVSVIALNRNTMTAIDVYDENGDFVGTEKLQLCLQHGYGDGMEQSCERQVKAVSNLMYNLPVNGYAAINLGGISLVNDAVGGVTVDVLEDIQVFSGSESYTQSELETLKKGQTVTLTGQEAYWYVRNRNDNVKASSDDRLSRQKQYLSSLISQLKKELVKNPAMILTLYKNISPYLVTDVTTTELTYLAGQAGNYSFSSDGITSIDGTTVPGEDGTATGHDEFNYDEDALYDLMIKTFYKEVEQ